MSAPGYYVCIQYEHDAGRAERLNVGLLVYCRYNDRYWLRMIDDLTRIRQAFALSDEEVQRARQEIDATEARIQSMLANWLLGTTALCNHIRQTQPRSMSDATKETFEELYRTLVLQPEQKVDRRVTDTGPTLPHIHDTGPTLRRVEPEAVRDALGAEEVTP